MHQELLILTLACTIEIIISIHTTPIRTKVHMRVLYVPIQKYTHKLVLLTEAS